MSAKAACWYVEQTRLCAESKHGMVAACILLQQTGCHMHKSSTRRLVLDPKEDVLIKGSLLC